MGLVADIYCECIVNPDCIHCFVRELFFFLFLCRTLGVFFVTQFLVALLVLGLDVFFFLICFAHFRCEVLETQSVV